MPNRRYLEFLRLTGKRSRRAASFADRFLYVSRASVSRSSDKDRGTPGSAQSISVPSTTMRDTPDHSLGSAGAITELRTPPAKEPVAGPLPYLLDIAALAEHLGVTPRHVRRLVAERRVPLIKWGHLIRFDPAEIAIWLERARVPEGRGT